MEENMNVTDVEVMDDQDFESTTDIVPVEAANDSEGGIDAGSVALGALAIVGAGFLLKKAYDGGKWVVGKVKDGIANLKNKKADDTEADVDEEASDQEPEAEEAKETSKPDK